MFLQILPQICSSLFLVCHISQLFLQQSPKLETSHPTPAVPSTITLLQTAQKNHSQFANGSADSAPPPSQQNSTVDNTDDAAASSNSSDVSTATATATATAIITTPTQAGKEAGFTCRQ